MPAALPSTEHSSHCGNVRGLVGGAVRTLEMRKLRPKEMWSDVA
jgi:hypothetical protein